MDQVVLHRIWRETVNRIERYGRLVEEGKGLEPALEFGRYVFWSGLCELCEAHSAPFPLKVDGAYLRWSCEELQRKVHERYRTGDLSPHIDVKALRTLHDKLDTIAGYLSHGVVQVNRGSASGSDAPADGPLPVLGLFNPSEAVSADGMEGSSEKRVASAI